MSDSFASVGEGEFYDLFGQLFQSLPAVCPNNAQPQVGIKARKLKKVLPRSFAAACSSAIPNTLANSLPGNAGDDTLVSLTGNDTLNDGLGNDTLTGGDGKDMIRRDSLLNALTNVETITDYNVADHTIHLENAILTALTTTGTLAAESFRWGAVAVDADDYVIYDDVTGAPNITTLMATG